MSLFVQVETLVIMRMQPFTIFRIIVSWVRLQGEGKINNDCVLWSGV